MPFTLFHLGPALAFGLPLRKYLHVPTFIVANVILDIEPLIGMYFPSSYPLHGYVHTFLAAFVVGIILAFVMFKLENYLHNFYTTIKLETSKKMKIRSFFVAGVFGTMLHVLFDSFLYSEMIPFFPFSGNPLLSLGFPLSNIIWACIWLGIFGLVYWLMLFVYYHIKKQRSS